MQTSEVNTIMLGASVNSLSVVVCGGMTSQKIRRWCGGGQKIRFRMHWRQVREPLGSHKSQDRRIKSHVNDANYISTIEVEKTRVCTIVQDLQVHA